ALPRDPRTADRQRRARVHTLRIRGAHLSQSGEAAAAGYDLVRRPDRNAPHRRAGRRPQSAHGAAPRRQPLRTQRHPHDAELYPGRKLRHAGEVVGDHDRDDLPVRKWLLLPFRQTRVWGRDYTVNAMTNRRDFLKTAAFSLVATRLGAASKDLRGIFPILQTPYTDSNH